MGHHGGVDGEAVRRVWLERWRWPDRLQSRVHGYLLGHDEHGTWLGLPGGHDVWGGEGVLYTGPHPVVVCVPDEAWWVARWYGHSVELVVDVTTPVRRAAADVLAVVDLDLGVISQQGTTRLVDAERFEEQRLLYEYPSSVDAGARRSAERVLDEVTRGVAPFTLATAQGWFAILRAVADGAHNGGASA